MDKNFKTRKLNNGVPVLMATYPDGETATIGISYNVGGRNEWKRGNEYDGISHFLEHQFFKGSPPLTPQKVNEALDDLGGLDNAGTTNEITFYYAKTLRSEVFNAIDLFDKLLIFGEISQEEFDKEAFVVKQEFRRLEDNPPFLLYKSLKSELFKGTSLEMDVIGNIDSLSKVSLRQMEEYRNEHYGLENAIILVIGNYDKEKVYDKLNETFGQRKVKSDKPRYQLTEYQTPTNSKLRVKIIEKDTPLVFYGLAIKTPGGKSEYRAALDILTSYITLGKSSLLQKQLVRSGVCAFAFSFTELHEDIGNLILVAGAPQATYPQAHQATMKMLHDALTMEITPELLKNICNRIEYDMRANLEEPMGMLYEQAIGYWQRGRFISMEEMLDEIRSVTIEKYNEVRNMVLNNLSGVYSIIGKMGDFKPDFPEGTWEGEFTLD